MKVSVIIPCYNQATYLPETLEAVLGQTIQDWECIIVNDGSIDDTEAIAKNYCRQDQRIRYISQTNKGLSAARNAGLLRAKGDYVQFLDADDVLLPAKLEKQVALLEQTDTDVCVCRHTMFTTTPTQTWDNQMSAAVYNLTAIGFLYDWGRTFVVAIHAGLFRKQFLSTNQILFNEKITACEDWLFWCTLVQKGARFVELNEKLALYRVHETSMTKDVKHMQFNRIKANFIIYEMLSEEEKDTFLQQGATNLLHSLLEANRNKIAEQKAASVDYKLGAALLKPLHWISHEYKQIKRKLL